LIAHVSAIFILPVLEKSVIFIDFRAIAHSISAREGGNTVYWKAMARKRTVDDSVTYWFPWKHPMARLWSMQFGVFDNTPQKMGSSARPYGPRLSVPLERRRASTIASFGAFPRKHMPNVGSALRASPLERRKWPGPQFLAVLMSRSQTCCARLQPRRVYESCSK